MKQQTKERYRKVVKYYYPDGTEFDYPKFAFYLVHIIFWIGYIFFSPINFWFSEYIGKREVYFERRK